MYNPVINSDFPDPDVIRVGDLYYMVSTTMFLMPGGDILCSGDLVNWRIIGHLFDSLGQSDEYLLKNGKHAYARGMWAPSFRYHKGVFYVCFACNDMKQSLLFTARDPKGPWERRTMGDFFYDSSLFFDDDDRVYIVHGNTTVHLTELDPETWGRKEGGLDRVLIRDKVGQFLGYEGSHLYKRNGKYYLFTCHMPRETEGRKTEDCFIGDSLRGEFVGKMILNDAMGYRPELQVAQGGWVDDPEGNLYLFMFQDRGALGRAPVIFPMKFDEDGYPAPDTEDNRVPLVFEGTPGSTGILTTDEGAFFGNDDFRYDNIREMLKLAPRWQISHEIDEENIFTDPVRGGLTIRTSAVVKNLLRARNTLTQRCVGPACTGEVTVDGSDLREGDIAGLCLYSAHYGGVALRRVKEGYEIVRIETCARDHTVAGDRDFYDREPVITVLDTTDQPLVRFYLTADFTEAPDRCSYGYRIGKDPVRVPGYHELYFKLDLFIGARFGLFDYSTREAGGCARFSEFSVAIIDSP